MKIAEVMGAFARSPLLSRMEKRRVGALQIVAVEGAGLEECAGWGAPCPDVPAHLAALETPQRAGLCTVRAWNGVHVVAWHDAARVWVCEEVAR